ncbi:T9SS type B sorting domain-containing protein [Cryomorpha ignava]|uniref:T9SS type B sorting domain-containing protein n=1 Tax=Cryomorpha ignava TaxID=101383 RepID=A0A7K3WRJ5_9FLAO|nr:gliding motility-associated C-terminal domain-containing protein [Cryomorpha ignava]NEN24300.1 T9SS type B sorting domain-containing protein [Cryomorpha ignava]
MKAIKTWNCAIGATILLLFAHTAFAQPNWEVNAPDYQYTMTATGMGIFNCTNSNNPMDRVAAFIDGEVRGVAAFGTEVNGVQLAYLTIYDHVAAGSVVSFKLYNAADDVVTDAVEEFVFSDGLIAGNQDAPFQFRDQYGIGQLSLSANTIFDFTETGESVGELFLINEIGDTLVGDFTFVNDSLGSDNSLFSILTSFLIWEGEVGATLPDTLSVHISGTTPDGCSLDQVLAITVQNTNVPPTGLTTDTLFVPENEPSGRLVGTLEALDETTGDEHVYAFDESGDVNLDHAAFELTGDKLYTTRPLDYETQNTYHLDIRITDLSGNSISTTILVRVIDVIELGELQASNLLSPNSDGYNDTFFIPNLAFYVNYELLVYNAIGNLVYDMRDYDNSWYGNTNRGVALPTGTYYYIFQEVDNNQNRFEGDIHLYRENKF